jgi:hypothetical protein
MHRHALAKPRFGTAPAQGWRPLRVLLFLLLLTPGAVAASYGQFRLDGKGWEFFGLVSLMAIHLLLMQAALLAKLFRFDTATAVHVCTVLVEVVFLIKLWGVGQGQIYLSDQLWLIWEGAGVALVPFLLIPPILQWRAIRQGHPTPAGVWWLMPAPYLLALLVRMLAD